MEVTRLEEEGERGEYLPLLPQALTSNLHQSTLAGATQEQVRVQDRTLERGEEVLEVMEVTASQQGKTEQLSNLYDRSTATYRTIERILNECPRYDWEIVDYPNFCNHTDVTLIPEVNHFYLLLTWNGDQVVPCYFNRLHLEGCTDEQLDEYLTGYIAHIKRIEKRCFGE